MTKRKFRSSQTQGNFPIKEINSLPSETIPDQSMSVQEILLRFASGTLPDIVREQNYSEDMPDLRGLDISEIYNLKQQASDDIDYLNSELAARERERQLSKLSVKIENPITEATIEPLTPEN